MNYIIYLNTEPVKELSGTECAHALFTDLKSVAEIYDMSCWLVDGDTGELLEEYDPDKDF